MNRTLARLLIAWAISPPRKEPPVNSTMWTVIGVLVIIMLIILLIPHIRP